MPITVITTSTTVAGTLLNAAANTLTIFAVGTTQTSTGGSCIVNLATSDNCDLRVDGTIYAQGSAIFLNTDGVTDSHSVIVGTSGILMGSAGNGANVQGANATVLNYGQIGSEGGSGVAMAGSSAFLANYGSIFSVGSHGVSLNGASPTLRNFGTISSDSGFGLNLIGATFSIVENFGTIIGSTTAIVGSESADRIFNSGILSGTVFLIGGNDLFVGALGSSGVVLGGDGADTLRGGGGDDEIRGDNDNDVLSGRAGDDLLIGGDGADRLVGNADDDIMIGGTGLDAMTGGGGADEFIFDALAEMGNAIQSDVISRFVTKEDKINLDAVAGLTFIGNAVFSAVALQVRYAKAAGQLQIDQNGDGVGDFFLQLDPGTVLVAGDLIL